VLSFVFMANTTPLLIYESAWQALLIDESAWQAQRF